MEGLTVVCSGRLAKKWVFFDRTIDLVIATHPDLDHIGGLVSVMKRFDINTILLTTNYSETAGATAFRETLCKRK